MSLFSGQAIYNYFNKIGSKIENTLKSYDFRQIKEFSEQDILCLADSYKINNIIVDFENANTKVTNGEGEIYNQNHPIFGSSQEYVTVKGKYIHFFAKVSGDYKLLNCNLCEQGFETFNYHDENYDNMELEDLNGEKCLAFSIFITDRELEGKDKEAVRMLVVQSKNSYLQSTNLKIDRLNKMINDFNSKLVTFIHQVINEKINDDSSLEFLSDAIGVELNSKNGQQDIGKKIEIVPKKADILLPERKKYEGYYLDKNNYGAIIATIRNHLIATENNPLAINKLHDEELIRDTVLWALNSNYFVSSGETFRNNGKTDILISFNDKSVFIAECKIWKGKEYISQGIDQLLSYSTWRDSKMAFLVFNTGVQDFEHVCSETKRAFAEHDGFKRFVSTDEKNNFMCEFKDKNNAESTITISVICANYVSR